MPENKIEYTVVYRSGSWDKASWDSVDCANMESAKAKRRDIEAIGFKSFIWKTRHINNIGLPVGFCRHANQLTGKMEVKNCNCT